MISVAKQTIYVVNCQSGKTDKHECMTKIMSLALWLLIKRRCITMDEPRLAKTINIIDKGTCDLTHKNCGQDGF